MYVAGVIPAPGRTLFELAPPGVEDIMQKFVDAEGDGWLIPVMNDDVLDGFYGEHGLSAGDRVWLRARAVGQPVGTYRDPAPDDLGAVDALARTYIVCAGDPDDPLITLKKPGYDVVTLDAGHWPMITNPAELSRMIDEVCHRLMTGLGYHRYATRGTDLGAGVTLLANRDGQSCCGIRSSSRVRVSDTIGAGPTSHGDVTETEN